MTRPTRPDAGFGSRWREVAPTAGLPLRFSDLFGGRTDFEAEAAGYLGLESLQLECSGTAAFVVALTTLHRLTGRRAVVVPAYTCPLVAIAVAQCGLELRLCDLAPDSLDMAPDRLAALCDGDTLAVVPTCLGGRVADVAPATAAARAAGAFVVEDAAQALGATAVDGVVGARGDVGFYSLAVGKGLTLFEGGLLWAKDEAVQRELARTSAEIVARGAMRDLVRSAQLLSYAAFYHPLGLALVYGPQRRRALASGDLEGAVGDRFPLQVPLHRVGAWRRSVGVAAFDRLGAFQLDNAARARRRVAALEAIPGLTVLDDRPAETGTWPFLLALAPDEARRGAVLDRLWASPLGVSRLFVNALPDYGYLRTIAPEADVPNARAFAARSFTVTNSPMLDDAGFARVVDEIGGALG